MTADQTNKLIHAADKFLGKDPDDLTSRERTILQQAIDKRALSRDPAAEFDDSLTLGQRLADAVAAFGGSWWFISGFGVCLVLWISANLLLVSRAFDPYPFIFLNLVLSMLAAIQAPVIMMSQNRAAQRDRKAAEHDYIVNLRAELEIMHLHDKIDAVRKRELLGIIKRQNEALRILRKP